ncbi:MAG: PAS domain S-box protein [Cyanobacteria bacterium]|nr:PAS domain S-box protein [Cyanobacteriota bacterium]
MSKRRELKSDEPVHDGRQRLVGNSNLLITSTSDDSTSPVIEYDIQYSFAKIVETSKDAIITFSQDGEIRSWNRGAEAIYGYRAEEVIGQNYSILVPHDRLDELDEVLKALNSDSVIEIHETVRHAKGGTPVFVSLQIAPLKDDDGTVFAGFSIGRDITRRKEAEEALLSQAEQLARANADLERFAWMAAHDLKEPIRTMTTYAHLIADELEKDQREDLIEMLRFMVDAGKRATQRIQDVLAYSSVAKNDFTLDTVDLDKLLRQVILDLKQTISESNAKIEFQPLPTVRANSSTIMLVFQNLLSNALKFCHRRPEIYISWKENNGFYVFAVLDNGIGIDKYSTKKIFDMFQRLEPNKYSGTGIGLAICRKIVELHGGDVWVDSEEGIGSTFYFSLPV